MSYPYPELRQVPPPCVDPLDPLIVAMLDALAARPGFHSDGVSVLATCMRDGEFVVYQTSRKEETT